MSKNKIEKGRGKILYYSLDQVATLLNISESKVTYYINLFSQYVKLEIINKQARLHEKEILKLDFLIDLHSKGISNKQAEEYFNNTAFNDFDSRFDNIIDPPFYEELSNSIKNIEKLVSSQNIDNIDNINKYYTEISNEISKIKSNFDLKEDISRLVEKIEENSRNTLENFSILLDKKNNELVEKISNLMKNSETIRSNKDNEFINEIKKNINILTSAYNIQAEMINEQKENTFKIKIINKLANLFKA